MSKTISEWMEEGKTRQEARELVQAAALAERPPPDLAPTANSIPELTPEIPPE